MVLDKNPFSQDKVGVGYQINFFKKKKNKTISLGPDKREVHHPAHNPKLPFSLPPPATPPAALVAPPAHPNPADLIPARAGGPARGPRPAPPPTAGGPGGLPRRRPSKKGGFEGHFYQDPGEGDFLPSRRGPG